MPVPFEALLPYGIMTGFMVITGVGLSAVKKAQNGGKRHRYALGRWDESDKPEAPPGFEVNNGWKVEYLTK